ncbi:hypothetical protein CgunFtcFv8_002318 [Champsocephalus gunnari]|uniref:Coiled-coil domain-containing protein 57 n=1 Tax=Champsocephalus gunnari TaxID=52237 RepID=A0AAN8CQR8_CHAGU|nr:hypothetical protein CgunFtcFv8_002318 [Champsocephalus gunnari]
MQSDGDSGLGELEAQLVRKEMEWKELQAAMVHQLETSLNTAQEECLSLRERYQHLKEDFQFNLAILDERDRELERYDALTSSALTEEKKRQEELNHFRMQVAGLEEQRTRAAGERQEELRKSRHNAGQLRLQLDELKRSMATQIQKHTEEYERMKWDSQCRIQELAGELTLQRQETTAASEAELRQREHEFNLKMDAMRAVVLSCDLKVKLLSKETAVQCQAHAESNEALHASQVFCEQLRSQLLHRDHETRDLTAAKDCRIKELEDKLKRMETKLSKEESNHIKKCEDVIQALKECALQLEAQYPAHTEKLQEMEKRVVKLQENVEVLAARVRCKLKDQQDALDLRDETIQRLRTEVDGTRTGLGQAH